MRKRGAAAPKGAAGGAAENDAGDVTGRAGGVGARRAAAETTKTVLSRDRRHL